MKRWKVAKATCDLRKVGSSKMALLVKTWTILSVDLSNGAACGGWGRRWIHTIATVAIVLRVIHMVRLALVVFSLSLDREPSPVCFSTSR